MNELLKDPEFQKLMPYLPYMIGFAILQLILWLLLGNSIRSTLLLIRKENRMMSPAQAFLIAVPLFNIYWNFMVVRHLRDSLNNEFFDRKVAVDENPTQKEGNIFAWSFLASNIPLPKFIGYITMFSTIIGFVLYWVKVVEYKKLLKKTEHMVLAEEIDVDSFTSYDKED